MTEIIDFKLSENYSFFDLTGSDSHPELVDENRLYAEQISDTGIRIVENLERVAELLEIIYREAGEKPQVLSGLRFGRLNRAVGGAWNSLHKKGMAVDFTLLKYDIKQMFFKIYQENLFEYHKVIYYKNRYFIHVSLPTGNGDGRALLKEGGRFKVVR